MSRNIQPPEDLTAFLNDAATFDEIEKIADKQDILVRRYDCLSYLQVPHVLSRVHQFPERGCYHEHDGSGGYGCHSDEGIPCDRYVGTQNSGLPRSRKSGSERNIYKLLVEHMGSKTGADLVFTTNGGKRLTHIVL